MTVIIDGTAGITFPDTSVQAVNATNASNLSTGTVPKARMYAGAVLQVIQGSYTGQVSTTSTSFVTTNLTASITPTSATSKILVMVSGGDCYSTTTNKVMRTTIYRNNSTNLATGGTTPCFGNGYNSAGGVTAVHSYSYLDSPATTSSTSYTVYMCAETSGAANYNQNGTTSYIQLMEIAA